MENENMKKCMENEAYTRLMDELEKGEVSGCMSEEEFLKKVNIKDE